MTNTVIIVNNKEYSATSLSVIFCQRRSGWFFNFSFTYENSEQMGLYFYVEELSVYTHPSLFKLEKYDIQTNWNELNMSSISSQLDAFRAYGDLSIKVLSIQFLSYNIVTQSLDVALSCILCDMYDEFDEKWYDIKILTEIEGYTIEG